MPVRAVGDSPSVMPTGLPPPWRVETDELAKLEEKYRRLATSATNPQWINLLLALADRYQAIITERGCEEAANPAVGGGGGKGRSRQSGRR